MNELKIVTLNIRCFGFDGEYFGKHKVESRIASIRRLLEAEYGDADIFVFQEIMNPLIVDKILPDGFKTYTYEHDFARHMFVTLACRPEFDIEDAQTIPGTTIDDTKSRPALYGRLMKDGNPVMDLIGVHLKSKYENSDKRKQQCENIVKFIETLPPQRPKVITGDFNTHFKEKTFKETDDIEILQKVFEKHVHLASHDQATYLAADDFIQLDHFFVSGLKVLEVKAYELADYAQQSPFKKYYDEISDHLPVSLRAEL